MNRFTITLLLMLVMGSAQAENILMARSPDNFEVTLQEAQKSLEQHGFTVAHIQRCDTGLGDFGYKTDRYRLLFIGKGKEIRYLTEKYPALIPYVPLKLAIFAEEDETLAAIFNPEELGKLFPQKELKVQFSRWKNDLLSVLHDIKKSSLTRD